MRNLRQKRRSKTPEMQISPMIDMIFLLLVFFIVSTMHMTQVKTMQVKLPQAQNTMLQKKTTFNIAIKADNTIWLEDQKISLLTLVTKAKQELGRNKNLAVVIRADEKVKYGTAIKVLDQLKGAGVSNFGMAAVSR